MRNLIATFVFIVASCASPIISAPIETMEWRVIAINGAALDDAQQTPITLSFNAEEKRASGFTGCNHFGGNYHLDAQEISFGPLTATEMACANGMANETNFLNAMRATTAYALVDSTLTFYTAQTHETLRFTGSTRHHQKQ